MAKIKKVTKVVGIVAGVACMAVIAPLAFLGAVYYMCAKAEHDVTGRGFEEIMDDTAKYLFIKYGK